MTDYAGLLRIPTESGIEYVVFGGVAAKAHGSARFTVDVDIVYRRTPENIDRVVDAFREIHPYLRGAPLGRPFIWDAETIAHGLSFTLITDLGAVDLLGEIPGGGTYEDMQSDIIRKSAFGFDVPCLSIQRLIATKRATARKKDLDANAELEALLEEQERE